MRVKYVHPGVQFNFKFSSLLIKLCRCWDGRFKIEDKVYPWFYFQREHFEFPEDQDTLKPRVRHVDGWTLTLPYFYVLYLCNTKDEITVTVPSDDTLLN